MAKLPATLTPADAAQTVSVAPRYRRRLLAIQSSAAAIGALLFGTPALAQAVDNTRAFQGIGVPVVPGSATILPSPNQDTIVINAPQAIIDWTPIQRTGTGPIDFLPQGLIGRFESLTDFTVLNRILPLDGANVPISRMIALNGIIQSQAGNGRGGNVWFYSPGGILVGGSAVINVGSLVLTSNAIDTQGGLYGPGGEIRFRGNETGGPVTIAPNAQISTFDFQRPGGSYVALVAPRVEQRGLVSADGSVAIVAAEQADIRINQGLFDITVTIGTDDPNGIVHTGSTGGPTDSSGTYQSRAYLVAIPKSAAITMLLSGNVGFQTAFSGVVDANGSIVLSAGHNIVGGIVASDPVNAAEANIVIDDSVFLNDLTVVAATSITARPLGLPCIACLASTGTGTIIVNGSASLTAGQEVSLTANRSRSIVVNGDLSVRAGTPGFGGTITVLADNVGAAPVPPAVATGGAINVTGVLRLDTVGIGNGGINDGAAGGGTVEVTVDGGQINAAAFIANASALGGLRDNGNGADGTGGSVDVTVTNSGVITTAQFAIDASGFGGGNNQVPVGGNGNGGSATVTAASGGTITVTGPLSIAANGAGSLGPDASGNGTGGNATLQLTDATGQVSAENITVSARGVAAPSILGNSPGFSSDTYRAGSGTGGTAVVISSGILNSSTLDITARGTGGNAAPGVIVPGNPAPVAGNGTGGTAGLTINGGTPTIGALTVDANGIGGSASDGTAGTGANGIGGTATLTLTNVALTLPVSGTISADGQGGQGQTTSGNGTGGTVTATLTNATLISPLLSFTANGTGGSGLAGDNDEVNPVDAGTGGRGSGGAVTLTVGANATLDTDRLVVAADGTGGNGGNLFEVDTGVDAVGAAGNGQGGTARLTITGGTGTIDSALVSAYARGGTGGNAFGASIAPVSGGGNGGNGTGGQANVDLNGPGTFSGIVVDSGGVGGRGGDGHTGGTGGIGQGGASVLTTTVNAGTISSALLSQGTGGIGGAGATAPAGNGGAGIGGRGAVIADGAAAQIIFAGSINVDGRGGDGGSLIDGGAGGAGRGGTIDITANLGRVTLAAAPLSNSANPVFDARGYGGAGGTGAVAGAGGTGSGGAIRLTAGGGTITTLGGAALTLNATGLGGLGAATGIAEGGRIDLSATNAGATPGLITLGSLIAIADGDRAGAIYLTDTASGAGINITSLNASATGGTLTAATPQGIFVASRDGAITIVQSATLTSAHDISFTMADNGGFAVGGALTLNARNDIIGTHSGATGPTVNANQLIVTAGRDLLFATGSALNGTTSTLLTISRNIALGQSINGGTFAATAGGTLSFDQITAAGGATLSIVGATTGGTLASSNGAIQSTGGAFTVGTVTANGNVRVNSSAAIGIDALTSATGSATLDAPGNVRVNAASIGQTFTVTTAANAQLGTTTSRFDTIVNAGGRIDIVSATTTNSGPPNGPSPAAVIRLTAGGDIGLGALTSAGDILLDAENITGATSALEANRNVTITTRGNTSFGTLQASRATVTSGGTIAFNTIATGGDLALSAVGLINGSTITGGGNVAITSTGAGIGVTDIAADDAITLAGNGAVAGNAAVSNNGAITIRTTGSVNYARLIAYGVLRIDAGGAVTLTLGRTLEPGQNSTAAGPLANPIAPFDIVINAGDAVNLGTLIAQNNILIDAASLTGPASILQAGTGIALNIVGDARFGTAQAGNSLAITSGGLITGTRAETIGTGGGTALNGLTGVNVTTVRSLGTTALSATNGAIAIADLQSTGAITAAGRTVTINGSNGLDFTTLNATAGDAVVTATGGNLIVRNATASGALALTTNAGNLETGVTGAQTITLNAVGGLTLGGATTATNTLTAQARDTLTVNAAAIARAIQFASSDIVIGNAGRVGAVGTTQSLSLTNNDSGERTFIGGADTTLGYSLSAAEILRLSANDIAIIAPRAATQGGGAVGLTRPPDVVVGAFTLAGGTGPTSNLGPGGTFSITTPGFARVIGAVELTGMTAGNRFLLDATEALEVILGQGSIRMTNGPTLTGIIDLRSDDIVVATAAAITAISTLTDTAAIDDRLAQNDGVTSDEGALAAGGIRFTARGGVYVQNSGTTDRFADRRGFTAGIDGVTVTTRSAATRIVINGRLPDALGTLTTGRDAIALVTIVGAIQSPTGGTAGFDPLSTINGCLIVNPAGCVNIEDNPGPPVQDVIGTQVDPDGTGDGFGTSLLIDIREVAPLLTDPLIDDPVTGTGNDDLWVAPDACDPTAGEACATP